LDGRSVAAIGGAGLIGAIVVRTIFGLSGSALVALAGAGTLLVLVATYYLLDLKPESGS
jgi:predicted tellurium resistance membrane protein TerC